MIHRRDACLRSKNSKAEGQGTSSYGRQGSPSSKDCQGVRVLGAREDSQPCTLMKPDLRFRTVWLSALTYLVQQTAGIMPVSLWPASLSQTMLILRGVAPEETLLLLSLLF